MSTCLVSLSEYIVAAAALKFADHQLRAVFVPLALRPLIGAFRVPESTGISFVPLPADELFSQILDPSWVSLYAQ